MNLHQRQLSIINYMNSYAEWHTGKELSKLFEVSIRTIRNDISFINKTHNCELIESSRYYGYKLNITAYNDNHVHGENNFNNEERLTHLLIEIMTRVGQQVHFYDLAEQYSISESTLSHDIQTIKTILSKYPYTNISIEKKHEFIICHGDYLECIRFLHLYIKKNNDYKDFKKFNFAFSNVELDEVRSLIHNFSKSLTYSRYLTFDDLFIFSSIILEQSHHIYDDSNFTFNNSQNDYKQLHISQLVDSLIVGLNPIQADFVKVQLFLMISPLVELEKEENTIKTETTIQDPMYPTLIKILENVNIQFNLDICSQEQLVLDFLIHIKISLLRIEKKVSAINPLIEHIRLNYTFLFDVAFYISKNLSKHLNLQFNNEEISFFVVYLIPPLKTIKDFLLQQYSIKILLYAIEGPAVAKNMKVFLLSELENNKVEIKWVDDINEVGVTSHQYFDLVLTTSSHIKLPVEHILINPFLTQFDIKNINSAVNRILEDKKMNHFSQLFDYFFSEKFTTFKSNVKNNYESIRFMCDKLIENNITPPNYFDQVLERENLISTAFDCGVSLPHATENSAHKSKIYFVNYNSSIDWSGKKIKSSFLFAIAKEDISILNLIYRIIIDICTSDYYASKLSKIKNIHELKQLMGEVYLDIN